jgi:hypothetical protein
MGVDPDVWCQAPTLDLSTDMVKCYMERDRGGVNLLNPVYRQSSRGGGGGHEEEEEEDDEEEEEEEGDRASLTTCGLRTLLACQALSLGRIVAESQ